MLKRIKNLFRKRITNNQNELVVYMKQNFSANVLKMSVEIKKDGYDCKYNL